MRLDRLPSGRFPGADECSDPDPASHDRRLGSRHQPTIIEYLKEENRILLEQLGGKRGRFTDAQRIRLDRKATPVGRRKLLALDPIVTPDTLLRVGRPQVDLPQKAGPGRPAVNLDVEKLVLKLMEDNPS